MFEDFSALKPGDKVYLATYERYSGRMTTLKIAEVEKVSATQITALGYRWLRRNGQRVGGNSFNASVLGIWTPAISERFQKDQHSLRAERYCRAIAQRLEAARGDAAISIVALLPDDLFKFLGIPIIHRQRSEADGTEK